MNKYNDSWHEYFIIITYTQSLLLTNRESLVARFRYTLLYAPSFSFASSLSHRQILDLAETKHPIARGPKDIIAMNERACTDRARVLVHRSRAPRCGMYLPIKLSAIVSSGAHKRQIKPASVFATGRSDRSCRAFRAFRAFPPRALARDRLSSAPRPHSETRSLPRSCPVRGIAR